MHKEGEERELFPDRPVLHRLHVLLRLRKRASPLSRFPPARRDPTYPSPRPFHHGFARVSDQGTRHSSSPLGTVPILKAGS